MKIRTGFVSNSSSSSFTCNVCGDAESGWDADPREFEWIICVNGHIVCDGCKLNDGEPEQKENETKEEFEKREDKWRKETDDGYLATECACPVCQFIEPSQEDAVAYLLKTYKIPKEEVFELVKASNKRRKKLYNHEYITYVCQKHSVELTNLLPEFKTKFETYIKFREWLRGK